MIHYTTLAKEIEAEYEAYITDPSYDLEGLYGKLQKYLHSIIDIHVKRWSYASEEAVDELTQETLLAIVENGLNSFRKGEALFTTYCSVVAKNKVIDWVRKQSKTPIVRQADSDLQGMDISNGVYYESPEKQILRYEAKLEQIALVKKYLKTLMDWPQKPYKTVGCGFTMVLFQKYFPASKELTSPKWAFESVQSNSVEEGAERFLREMQEWFPRISFLWGTDFLDAMDELEDGVYVRDIIFGENFRVKDFENWSRRLQPKIKRYLLEIEGEGNVLEK